MSQHRVWKKLAGVDHTVIESVDLEDVGGAERVVVRVRPTWSRRGRCSRCGRRCGGYDRGEGRRRWRSLDAGTMIVELEADAPRVRCPVDGVVVAAVPWARPGSRFTSVFEDVCAWLAAHASGSTVAELLRVAWRSVTSVVERVIADALEGSDCLDGVTRIGIDEFAHRKGHRYLTAVTDHDTGRLIWAAPGRSQAIVETFFDALGPERSARIRHVSADGAEWIHAAVRARAPQAVICIDAFHVVEWATKALDQVRRDLAGELRRAGAHDAAAGLKGTRWALIKNPFDLTTTQRTTLAGLAKTNNGVYRGYLLKEQMRAIFAAKATTAAASSADGWPGRNGPSSNRSSSWPERLSTTSRSSSTRSSMTCRTLGPKPPTSTCVASPDVPTGSTVPKHSSPWPCSPEEASAPNCPADENDPRKQQ